MMSGDRIEVDEDGSETVFVEIDDIRHMMMAPPRDIFSTRPYVYMGQSVVDRLLEHFKLQKGLERQKHRLVLLMRPDMITPNLSEEFEAAMDRYTKTKIEDNQNKMAAIHRRGILEIPYAMIFLIISVSLGFVFRSEAITGIPSVWASVLSEGFFIVGWVAMWGPLDTLLFERFPLKGENRALRALERMKIEVRPLEVI
jgi:hypothetical protein